MTVVPSNYARSEKDFYQTEPWVTEALLRHLPVVGMRVWDPCAGNHLMSDVLKEGGAKKVYTSDIKTYDREHDKDNLDFFNVNLLEIKFFSEFDAIIANPPYGTGNRLAARWADRSLTLCRGWVALLLTMKFDSGRTRTRLFRDNPRFHSKIVLLDRISWTLDDVSGTEDHAWFIWGPRPKRPRQPTIVYEEKPR